MVKGKASTLEKFYKSESPKARKAQTASYKTHLLAEEKAIKKNKLRSPMKSKKK